MLLIDGFSKRCIILQLIKLLQTSSEYFKEYQKYLLQHGSPYSKYHGYAFDGVWVIAKAVDAVIRKAVGNGLPPTLTNNLFRGDHLAIALNSTDFRGVTVTM
ncbi:hypothetical protein DPMN_012269 [Dreissena polymorpha]|uniref:Receptor ligand binding region domain-containing protein n=1 Tax=Dreissena polymorpha TaxID=45954 RepID=A0A9D4N7P4_DREPO|nr:hypothetical protein DPMN_012269 [Dreissena polymorpha]